jgi:hypothetical protein
MLTASLRNTKPGLTKRSNLLKRPIKFAASLLAVLMIAMVSFSIIADARGSSTFGGSFKSGYTSPKTYTATPKTYTAPKTTTPTTPKTYTYTTPKTTTPTTPKTYTYTTPKTSTYSAPKISSSSTSKSSTYSTPSYSGGSTTVNHYYGGYPSFWMIGGGYHSGAGYSAGSIVWSIFLWIIILGILAAIIYYLVRYFKNRR